MINWRIVFECSNLFNLDVLATKVIIWYARIYRKTPFHRLLSQLLFV